MIGIKGKPLTSTFEWARWRPGKRELIQMGATEVLTDAEAERQGYQVANARRLYELETSSVETAKKLLDRTEPKS